MKILYAKVCYIVSAVYIKMLGWASFAVALHSMAAPLVGDLPEDFEALYMSIIIKNLVKFITILYAKFCSIVSAVFIEMLSWASFVVGLHSMAAPPVGGGIVPKDFARGGLKLCTCR